VADRDVRCDAEAVGAADEADVTGDATEPPGAAGRDVGTRRELDEERDRAAETGGETGCPATGAEPDGTGEADGAGGNGRAGDGSVAPGEDGEAGEESDESGDAGAVPAVADRDRRWFDEERVRAPGDAVDRAAAAGTAGVVDESIKLAVVLVMGSPLLRIVHLERCPGARGGTRPVAGTVDNSMGCGQVGAATRQEPELSAGCANAPAEN
jgi:hypothetical protein